jgi:hypothetical protein
VRVKDNQNFLLCAGISSLNALHELLQVSPDSGAPASFNPGAEEYNDQREAGRLGFTSSPGPRIRQTFTSPPLKDAPKINHASEET